VTWTRGCRSDLRRCCSLSATRCKWVTTRSAAGEIRREYRQRDEVDIVVRFPEKLRSIEECLTRSLCRAEGQVPIK